MVRTRSALLLMDFQNGVVDRPGNASAVDAAGRAATAARGAGIPVLFVRVAFRPGYPEIAENNIAFAGASRAGDSLHEDHPNTEIHAALKPADDEPIIVKRRISAFTGSDLDVLLRAAGAESIVIAGISTSGVVLSTLRQAADLDYRITVLSDACADRDPEVHRVLIEKVFPHQAQVCSTQEWADSLRQRLEQTVDGE